MGVPAAKKPTGGKDSGSAAKKGSKPAGKTPAKGK
jgi:hypothetical protein